MTINVKDYGVTGDGFTYDLPNIQKTIKELKSGDTIYFPEGVYNCKNTFIWKIRRLFNIR